MKVKREKFLADEAALYARWYRQVQKIVRETAAQKSIRMVVKTSPETFDDKDRAAVLQAVNRPIVFQDQLDITDEVIAAINAG
jgi:Skp family chaperone for outer membrane proteins